MGPSDRSFLLCCTYENQPRDSDCRAAAVARGVRLGSGGVQGTALIEGGPAPGNPRPEPGVTVAVHKGGLHGTIVARTKASPSGAFKISLSPGKYTLVEVSDAAVPRTVTVKPGKYVTVVLTIQAM